MAAGRSDFLCWSFCWCGSCFLSSFSTTCILPLLDLHHRRVSLLLLRRRWRLRLRRRFLCFDPVLFPHFLFFPIYDIIILPPMLFLLLLLLRLLYDRNHNRSRLLQPDSYSCLSLLLQLIVRRRIGGARSGFHSFLLRKTMAAYRSMSVAARYAWPSLIACRQ